MSNTEFIESALNLIGIFAFALSGALVAVHREFDVVGMAVLATATALGGGIIRDVLLGDTPPTALRTLWWLVLPLIATAVVFFFHPVVSRLRRTVLVFDAVGLGVFCASATAKASALGSGALAAVLLGTITGVGGGIIRDVLAGEVPAVLRKDSKLYAVPAVVGSSVVAIAWSLDQRGVWVQASAATLICVLRLLALWRGWSAPVPPAVSGTVD